MKMATDVGLTEWIAAAKRLAHALGWSFCDEQFLGACQAPAPSAQNLGLQYRCHQLNNIEGEDDRAQGSAHQGES